MLKWKSQELLLLHPTLRLKEIILLHLKVSTDYWKNHFKAEIFLNNKS